MNAHNATGSAAIVLVFALGLLHVTVPAEVAIATVALLAPVVAWVSAVLVAKTGVKPVATPPPA